MNYTPEGTAITKFSVAVDNSTKQKKDTLWVNVVSFGFTAEAVATYLSKGKSCIVHGRMRQNRYTDRNNLPQVWTELVADRVEFTGKKDDQPVEVETPPPTEEVDLANPF